jgi:hypothetical protein
MAEGIGGCFDLTHIIMTALTAVCEEHGSPILQIGVAIKDRSLKSLIQSVRSVQKTLNAGLTGLIEEQKSADKVTVSQEEGEEEEEEEEEEGN